MNRKTPVCLSLTNANQVFINNTLALSVDFSFYTLDCQPQAHLWMRGSHFQRKDFLLYTVYIVSALFLAGGRAAQRDQKTTSLKMKVMWVWSSEALHQDPDSEIPCEPLPRLFQIHRRLSFIFSVTKRCFFRHV